MYQFLTGLDDVVFGNLGSQILNTTPLSKNKLQPLPLPQSTGVENSRSSGELLACSYFGKQGHDITT